MMGKPRMKIKIGNKKRFITFLLCIIITVAAALGIAYRFGRTDPVVKQIEQQENQSVSIKDIQIKAYIGEAENKSTALDPETQLDYKAVYVYALESGYLSSHFVTDNITVKVSDPAMATVINNSSVVISNSMTQNTEITVTVTYDNGIKKYKQAFPYQVVVAPVGRQ
jgi:hypothetical protein